MGRERDRRENVEGIGRDGESAKEVIGRESGRQIKTEVIKRAVGRERRKEKRRRWEVRHLNHHYKWLMSSKLVTMGTRTSVLEGLLNVPNLVTRLWKLSPATAGRALTGRGRTPGRGEGITHWERRGDGSCKNKMQNKN